jgi:hypothetical protein
VRVCVYTQCGVSALVRSRSEGWCVLSDTCLTLPPLLLLLLLLPNPTPPTPGQVEAAFVNLQKAKSQQRHDMLSKVRSPPPTLLPYHRTTALPHYCSCSHVACSPRLF